tara:strand:- start:22607 stop:23134 length:528 start_codon:yes stop_codon:yes gene_type:complete
MTYYCTTDEVALRLGFDSAQKVRAQTRLTSSIRRATVVIDSVYRDYGRPTPSREIATTTLNGSVAAGATTITLTSASTFSAAGNGNIDGDSFAWSGKSSNDLTGVSGISADHATGVTVEEGEMAEALRQICADYAAGLYLQDDAALSDQESLRSPMLIERANELLFRYAKLGSVD